MAEHARRISAENLDQRLPVRNPRDELGQLAATFNELLERLGVSFARRQQFMADASHELRTPLTALRTTAAVTLQREDRNPSEYREALTIVEQQARRMSRIVEDMFLLARADARHRALQFTDFYLDELLADTVRAATALASQKNVHLKLPPLPEAPFRGDEGLLRQMLWNLLDNAIKFTPQHGTVRIELRCAEKDYAIEVADTGPGISTEAQRHIFERFYHTDTTRTDEGSSEPEGAGLGLPIALWIAQVHGGRLELRESSPGGSTFVAVLPRS
jgi:signal transduction histidine kinase